MSIADNIKNLRTSHKLSQAEFGKIAGVSDKAVSTWENGEKTPRMGAIQKLADHFGVLKSEIIDDTPTQINSTPTNDVTLAPDEKQLLDGYRSFNDEGKDKVLDTISDMLQLDRYKKGYKSGVDKKEA